jgi:hypothetical protein
MLVPDSRSMDIGIELPVAVSRADEVVAVGVKLTGFMEERSVNIRRSVCWILLVFIKLN